MKPTSSSLKSTKNASERRRSRRSTARKALASELPPGSSEQVQLVHLRISAEVCLECGQSLGGNYEFCSSCREGFPKEIEIEGMYPFDGWRYVAVQTKPAIHGLDSFTCMRIGIYERRGRSEWIRWAQTFEEAKAALLKKWNRAVGAAQ